MSAGYLKGERSNTKLLRERLLIKKAALEYISRCTLER